MKALEAAIITAFKTAIPTCAIYQDVPADDTAYPYCIWTDVAGSLKHFYDGDIQTQMVAFKFYDTGAANVRTLQESLHTRFDRTKLTLTGSSLNISTLRDSQSTRVENKDKAGNQVYSARSVFRFLIQP